MNGLREARIPISVLLPHEVFHALATCDASLCFQSLFFGNIPPPEIARFWVHARTLDPWKQHPHLSDRTIPLDKLAALQFHADGAEFFRDDECFCYSFSSIFSTQGVISDVMLYRFPLLLIHERHMDDEKDPSKNATQFSIVCLFTLPWSYFRDSVLIFTYLHNKLW